ncbi:hypothetical protein BDV96DRAFT_488040 [Lophiotrema nucula]|uniref:T6SS Phospholipase effector Tle1-like catalytic domain-containing protein n=1 Tax=Lophiotrema nucula TaxID=690887 RepID=A0A6A5ZFB7_9PLEO|nr:hypothetical protein BDV96DRAFT_488040 [Lophiotrema nucula]
MSSDTPWPRRIVICCDGTWQSSVSGKENVPSNVTKLARHISRIGFDRNDPNKRYHQLVYYDSGVGTGNLSKSEQRRQGGTGSGLAENVIEAYNFIVLNYEPGDEIFCFGFSRGAFTARAVAGLVTDIGVIRPQDMQLFPEIYRSYMSNEEGLPFRETQAWRDFVHGKLTKKGKELEAQGGTWGPKEHAEAWEIHAHGNLEISEASRKVRVVGVWDTVGSLGIPDVAWFDFSDFRTQYGFHNVKLNENIEHAFHALALDERRKAFRPTVWYIPEGMKENLLKQGKPLPELKQVWFPGVHINSGGGSDDAIGDMKGDLEILSTATVCWMLQCIDPYLTIDRAAFKQTMLQYERWLQKVRYACTYHHKTWKDTAKSFIPNIPVIHPAPNELTPPRRDPPHTHDHSHGWGCGDIVDSYGGMYKLQGPLARVPGHCQAEIYNPKKKEYVLEDIHLFGETNEYIHPICHYRDLIRGPEPLSALRDFKRQKHPAKDGKVRFWWNHNSDNKPLPEWVILKDADGDWNFERYFYHQSEKTATTLLKLKKAGYEKDWLETLDDEIDFTVGAKQGHEYP